MDLGRLINHTPIGYNNRIPKFDTNTQQINIITYNINVNGSDQFMNTSSKRGGKMKAAVVLTSGEDGYVIAECPALPGCMSQGKSKEEAVENIKEAMQLCIETRKEMGLPEFEEMIEVEV